MSIEELYAHCVLYLGIDPKYFLDEMQWYEIGALMKYSYKKHMVEFECMRTQAYVVAQVNSKKHLTPQSIMKFEWDDEKKMTKKRTKKGDIKQVTDDDMERLREKSKQFMMNFKTLPEM